MYKPTLVYSFLFGEKMDYIVLLSYSLPEAEANQHKKFKDYLVEECNWEKANVETTLIARKSGISSKVKESIEKDIKNAKKVFDIKEVVFTYSLSTDMGLINDKKIVSKSI